MFPSLLVANRGEIACRIFRTARAMGIKCIAVYSEADARAKHVRGADEAYPIGPAPAADSYLNIARVLEAAKKSGAAAIHPGYGFLSENPDFAEAVIKAGIVWVGPQPAAIRAMGLKDEAKRIAEEAGAPVVPGYRGADQSEAVLMSAAKEIGFPVLIKAVAGGGGRGIREVREAGEFSATLASAQREAKAAFGDDRVLVEKLIARPRHIEVQVFGDSHGNLVHLFERDCSLQRRRQKVIEEAPAPGMTDEARAAMTEAALKIAGAVNYQNAGTVEFIVEGAPRPDNFYFMEMNTRLQVEHPVTEAITGVDLVEWQLRVAAGEELPLAQDDIEIHGHAIEARINAEDPAHEYRPSVGRISHCAWPRHAHSVHAGFERGDEVSPHYDSLIAKIVALSLDGETCDEARLGALATLKRAISAMEIVGIETNARFVQRCLGLSDFYWGNLHTSLIADHLEELVSAHRDDESAALLLSLEDMTQPVHDPWGARDGWRANAESRAAWRWTIHGRQLDVRLHAMNAGVSAVVSGETETVRHLGHDSTGQFFATPVFGFRQEARIERLDGLRRAFMGGGTFDAFPPGAQFDLDEASASDSILAPLPGKIAAVNAKPGDAVKRGDVLAVLEAMKMEHALTAPRAGVVEEVAVQVGAQVKLRDLIVRLAAQA